MKIIIAFIIGILSCNVGIAQSVFTDTTIQLLKNEAWWGGAVIFGKQMPFGEKDFAFNLQDYSGNQNAPVLISNKGRWVWSEQPFAFSFHKDSLHLSSKDGSIRFGVSGNNLQTAYTYCSKNFFPTSGDWVDSLLITSPQYNLWIELMYEPTQEKVLDYAYKVIGNKMPVGVLMIDDNWSNYYGEFDFNIEKFPHAKKMVDSLHDEGFKVMLWVCPFVSPDSKEFRELEEKRYLLLDNNGNDTATWKNKTLKPLIINWWNGYSACLDLTNPGAIKWLKEKLNYLQNTYGIDGFKFDAGDAVYYSSPDLVSYKKATAKEQSEAWAKIGLDYKLNEYRAMWKMGGQPLVQRLRDKEHTWNDLQTLIPNTIAQQLEGYTFTCPDMIGGGSFTSFLPGKVIDQDLIVRSAQCQALMPMMQFSVAPWRVLDSVHLQAVLKVVHLRQKYMPYIMNVMKKAVRTGQPAVRPLEYDFPGQNLENVKEQFMLGDKIMVAPVVEKGFERQVIFPAGRWRFGDKIIRGGKIKSFKVPLDKLLIFERIED